MRSSEHWVVQNWISMHIIRIPSHEHAHRSDHSHASQCPVFVSFQDVGAALESIHLAARAADPLLLHGILWMLHFPLRNAPSHQPLDNHVDLESDPPSSRLPTALPCVRSHWEYSLVFDVWDDPCSGFQTASDIRSCQACHKRAQRALSAYGCSLSMVSPNPPTFRSDPISNQRHWPQLHLDHRIPRTQRDHLSIRPSVSNEFSHSQSLAQ